MAEKVLSENVYPTLEKPLGTGDNTAIEGNAGITQLLQRGETKRTVGQSTEDERSVF